MTFRYCFVFMVSMFFLLQVKGQNLDSFDISGEKYSLNIPDGYVLKKKKKGEAQVITISNLNDTSVSKFVGGFYFGEEPYAENPINSECPVDSFYHSILGKENLWRMHYCHDRIFLQSLISDSNKKLQIHAYGSAPSLAGSVNLYHTLRSLLRTKD